MINEYLYKTKNISNGELNEHCFQTINICIVINWNIPYDGTHSCILRDKVI